MGVDLAGGRWPRDDRPTGVVLIVSSSGGVLLDVLAAEPWWSRHPTAWVAVPAPDTVDRLRGRTVVWRAEPERTPQSLARALVGALALMRRRRPAVVLSAGNALAVPFFLAAQLLGVPSVWIETLNVLDRPGTASAICGRLATAVLVQHEEMLDRYRRGVFVGELY